MSSRSGPVDGFRLAFDRHGPVGSPAVVLLPQHDPLFPRDWADRLDDYFVDARPHRVDGAGHFTPLECPQEFADLILDRVRPSQGAG